MRHIRTLSCDGPEGQQITLMRVASRVPHTMVLLVGRRRCSPLCVQEHEKCSQPEPEKKLKN